MREHEKTLTIYTAAFVDELVRSGARHAVVSPGSRSTPVALLMAEHADMDVSLHVDERSAAFFALGMAKAKNEPVVILCTSGTAAANYYPAIIEAKLARVPLVVITADRPHELRDMGAPQTIDQIRLFGTYPKWFVDMALPEKTEDMLHYARMNAARATATALTAPAGPVHVNFPFREPLTPDLSLPSLWEGGRVGRTRFTTVTEGKRSCRKEVIDQLAAELSQTEKGLFVCGPNSDASFAEAIVEVAKHLNFPILADPLSQLRTGGHDKQLIIDSYDAFLRVPEAVRQLQPTIIIRFGAMPVSKAFLLYVKNHPDCRQIVIDEGGEWRDPTLSAADFIYTDPDIFCKQLLHAIGTKQKATKSDWLETWQTINEVSKQQVQKTTHFNCLFEGQVMLETIALLPEKATLFVGNSMPVRDLDTFLLTREQALVTMANRGANGIDGVISTALGASTEKQPLVLVIGDLSFYHDLNGLLAAKLHSLSATIIVLNNDGGGIFSFLPQAENDRPHFEELFGTPIGLDYERVVAMYDGNFERVHSWPSFRQSLQTSLHADGLNVIEVATERNTNAAMHRDIWKNVNEAVKQWLSSEGETN